MSKETLERMTPWEDLTEPAAPSATQPTTVTGRRSANRKATILGSMVIGGVAGAALLGPLSSLAASPAPTTTTPAASAGTSAEGNERGGPAGHVEAVTDTSVVAKAIGISEADLLTALNGGQTPAQVATAHGVAVQKVIDALVADGQSELAADVSAGRITQAEADAEKAEISQRATDQVNGSLGGRH